jgi:hypothetical protein
MVASDPVESAAEVSPMSGSLDRSFVRLVAGLALVMLIAFALAVTLRARPALAQEAAGPFVVGRTVSLRYEPTGRIECRIEAVQGAFVKCASDKEDDWYNTALVHLVVIKR